MSKILLLLGVGEGIEESLDFNFKNYKKVIGYDLKDTFINKPENYLFVNDKESLLKDLKNWAEEKIEIEIYWYNPQIMSYNLGIDGFFEMLIDCVFFRKIFMFYRRFYDKEVQQIISYNGKKIDQKICVLKEKVGFLQQDLLRYYNEKRMEIPAFEFLKLVLLDF